MKRLFLSVFLCLFLFVSKSVFATEIIEMRLASSSPDTVRFVAELSAESNPKVSRLENPPRLVIDFPKVNFSISARKQQFGKTGFVGGVRTGTPTSDTARVVLDLPQTNLTENLTIVSKKFYDSKQEILRTTPINIKF